jgi:hypothetical protein
VPVNLERSVQVESNPLTDEHDPESSSDDEMEDSELIMSPRTLAVESMEIEPITPPKRASPGGMTKRKRGRPITDFRTRHQKNVDRRTQGSVKTQREGMTARPCKNKNNKHRSRSRSPNASPLVRHRGDGGCAPRDSPTNDRDTRQPPSTSDARTSTAVDYNVENKSTDYNVENKSTDYNVENKSTDYNVKKKFTGSSSTRTRFATSNTEQSIYNKAVFDNEESWRKLFQQQTRDIISIMGAPIVSALLKDTFEKVNKECGATLCHPGALHVDGCACSGITTITHKPCPQTPAYDIPSAWDGLLYMPILKGMMVFVKDDRSINKNTTIARYTGTIYTDTEYQALPEYRKAFGVQKQSSTEWVVPVVERVGKYYMPPKTNPGARIARSTTKEFNCCIKQTCDGSLVVITTAAVNGGQQLLFQKPQVVKLP